MVIYAMLRNLGPAAFRGTLNAFFTAKQHRGDRRASDQRNFDCFYL